MALLLYRKMKNVEVWERGLGGEEGCESFVLYGRCGALSKEREWKRERELER